MTKRNGTDIVESTVEVRPDGRGAFNVVSVVTTLEYTGASSEFAEFLAAQLRDHGTIYPKPVEGEAGRSHTHGLASWSHHHEDGDNYHEHEGRE